MNRLEDGSASLSVGGSQSQVMGVGAGVEGREGAGAGVHGGAVGVLGSRTWGGGGRDEESDVDLSATGVGGGALGGALAANWGVGVCAVPDADLDFDWGGAAAAGVFLR